MLTFRRWDSSDDANAYFFGLNVNAVLNHIQETGSGTAAYTLPVRLFVDHFQQRFCIFNIFVAAYLFLYTHTHTHTQKALPCAYWFPFYSGSSSFTRAIYWRVYPATETKPSARVIDAGRDVLSRNSSSRRPCSKWFRLPVFPSIFLSVSFLRSHIIKVLWYIITVHIYLKSPLGECLASPPLLSLRIIKCYYLHPVRLLSQPLITSTALNKKKTR